MKSFRKNDMFTYFSVITDIVHCTCYLILFRCSKTRKIHVLYFDWDKLLVISTSNSKTSHECNYNNAPITLLIEDSSRDQVMRSPTIRS